MKAIYLPLATALFMLGLVALNPLQAQRNCGAMEYLELQMQNDAKRALKMQQIELQTRNFIENEANRAVNGVITIPVVVHVVYNTSAENISVAQIQSQIDVLNEDFRRLNSDADGTWSQADDAEIEFCLASVDPNGNPTNGITRTPTNNTSFGTNDQVKFSSSGGKDAWPASDYLNVWVCDISGGILGYAQFPGGNPATDGVVNDYQYFGTTGTASAPFDLGRTMTHEVGHYLNLRHIWGDGGCGVDDFVGDTPTSDNPNYGCATNHVSCGTTDMVQNYMDYSDDACMNLFTAGQKSRMRAIFDTGGFRASLLNSSACGTAPEPTCSDGIQNGQETGIDCGGPDCAECPPPPPCTDVTVTINLDNYPEETSWVITNANNATVASGGTYGSQPDGSTVQVTVCLEDGCYNFTINDSYGDGICCAYGNGSYTVTTGGTTVASGGSFNSSETTNFCVEVNGPTPTCTDGIQNGQETGVDCGGPDCAPCEVPPTCTDGIQNGQETGVDCGGPDCAPCNTGGCQTVNIDFNDFEGGFGIWNDGGSDCILLNSSVAANSGTYSVILRDNSSSSVMTTDVLNLTGYEEVTIDFTYLARSMENGEDFLLEYSTNGGSSYTTAASWVSGTDFVDRNREFESVVISTAFTGTTTFRFRCDASANNDIIYIDDVNIDGCVNNGNRQTNPETTTPDMAALSTTNIPGLGEVKIFPNPTRDLLNIDYMFNSSVDGQVVAYVTDMTGKVVQQRQWTAQQGNQREQLDASQLSPGIYLLHLISGDQRVTQKFVVIQ